MILSIKGIVLMALILLMFGGAVYDLTATGGRCGLSVANPGSGYSCEDFYKTIGKTFIMPDQNIGKGVEGVLAIRNADQETLDKIGMLKDVGEVQFRNQILIGLVGLAALFLLLCYIVFKLSPSSGIDAGSWGVSVLAAFLIITAIMVMFDDGPEHGNWEIPGANTPYKGLRNLMAHPEVLSSVIDDTSLLPGTMTPEDITILEEES